MTFTPYISIYPEGEFNYSWFGHNLMKATLIFSKNLAYNKKLFRKRVNIHLGNEDRIHTDSTIKSLWIKNNIDTSKELSDIDKINLILKIIYDSLITISKIEGWDIQPIEKAYQASVADQGLFVWHSKLKSNKNRRLKARVKILLEESGKVPVIAEFFDNKSNFQFKVHVIDTFLHFLDWERVFSKPGWLDNDKFGFSLINSQLLIFADSESRQSGIVISEKDWNREEVKGQLRRLTFKQFSSNKEFMEWANK
jgi:hypothetical protein